MSHTHFSFDNPGPQIVQMIFLFSSICFPLFICFCFCLFVCLFPFLKAVGRLLLCDPDFELVYEFITCDN